mmetsp:Transcript_41684/g.107917  ORF Transcript_41684/g.107917 Transcript_41684/m.107917 type:complete len:282 (-) Transcript_41684:241-1086(-)
MDMEMPLVFSAVKKAAGPSMSLMRPAMGDAMTSFAKISISMRGTLPRLFSITARGPSCATQGCRRVIMRSTMSLAVAIAGTRIQPGSPWTPMPISMESSGMGGGGSEVHASMKAVPLLNATPMVDTESAHACVSLYTSSREPPAAAAAPATFSTKTLPAMLRASVRSTLPDMLTTSSATHTIFTVWPSFFSTCWVANFMLSLLPKELLAMKMQPFSPVTAAMACTIPSTVGAAHERPRAVPASMPGPTNSRSAGSWPVPPPETTATLSFFQSAQTTTFWAG